MDETLPLHLSIICNIEALPSTANSKDLDSIEHLDNPMGREKPGTC